jgi:GMP synthase PP-ATPase subunit
MPDLEKRTEEIAKQDFQCLCALMENKTSEIDIGPNFTYGINIEGRPKITESKVTGMIENKRSYTNMLLIDSPNHTTAALAYTSEDIIRKNLDRGIGRCAVLINERKKEGKYIAILRSVLTKDFTKAEATPISRDNLDKIADNLLDKGPISISGVFYDVTDKPPATIEFE